jgi:hypothetical protein
MSPERTAAGSLRGPFAKTTAALRKLSTSQLRLWLLALLREVDGCRSSRLSRGCSLTTIGDCYLHMLHMGASAAVHATSIMHMVFCLYCTRWRFQVGRSILTFNHQTPDHLWSTSAGSVAGEKCTCMPIGPLDTHARAMIQRHISPGAVPCWPC